MDKWQQVMKGYKIINCTVSDKKATQPMDTKLHNSVSHTYVYL